jgi:SAM-dependent methyltransferase
MMAPESNAPPRELGSHYTPQALAHRMVAACLDRWVGNQTGMFATATDSSCCRVLDPACGDGAFLLEVFDELCRRFAVGSAGNAATDDHFAERRLEIVRRHIFGVDIDPAAIEALRSRLITRIGATGELTREAAGVIEANFRCGNALTGPAAGNPDAGGQSGSISASGAIDWHREFPEAMGAGGFDVILGNPPYLRERNARALFDALATTELGRHWRTARMDLWYYFVHRSLDLLRPGGILSFIVSSYWMSSRGAGRLVDRLSQETIMEEILLFDRAPVFEGVSGRHMIFRLMKRGDQHGRSRSDRKIVDACRVVVDQTPAPRRGKQRAASTADSLLPGEYFVPLNQLYQSGRLVVARTDPNRDVFRGRSVLGESFATRQGMAENPPRINRRLYREAPERYPLGEGVFVLTASEIERLRLLPTEQRLLRPYYDLSAVTRYRLAEAPTHSVLYLTRRTAPDLNELPNLARQLNRFRPILERRREARRGTIAWWHLHWPRAEEIFIRPRILSVQMGRRPQFVFVERPAYVGFSINAVLGKDSAALPLDALTGILNSDLAQSWFARHAKRRGVNLEINAHLLRQFPLPGRDDEIERQIGQLVRDRQRLDKDHWNAEQIEREIEDLVAQLYRATSTGPDVVDNSNGKLQNGHCKLQI